MRKRHLVSEITREPEPVWLSVRGFNFSRLGSRRRATFIVAFAAAVLVGGGSAIAAAVLGSDGAPLQLGPQQGTTPSLGTDAASITAAVKARVPNVLSISITSDPITDASGTTSSDQLVAHISVSDESGGAGVARAMWEGDVAGGALVTAFTQAGLTPPAGTDITLVQPDGTQDNIGGGLGNVVTDQVFDPITSAIQDQIKQNAEADGLSNVQVKAFPVINDVAEIRASTTADPATAAHQFFAAGGLDGLLGESANDFEGVLFQLDNAQGNPIVVVSAAPRAGGGGSWTASSTGISPEGGVLERSRSNVARG